MAHRPARRSAFGLLLCGLLLTTAGCGGVGTVKGKVTSKDKTVQVAEVVFLASDNTTRQAKVQDDGTYEIANVPTGKGMIAVVSRDPAPPASTTPKPGVEVKVPTAEDKKLREKWFKIPDKYSTHAESGITINVTRGDNKLDLKLD